MIALAFGVGLLAGICLGLAGKFGKLKLECYHWRIEAAHWRYVARKQLSPIEELQQ